MNNNSNNTMENNTSATNNSDMVCTVHIPVKLESDIRLLCSMVNNTEWSGILFYNITECGDTSISIECIDMLPMDVGTSVTTEYDMDIRIAQYIAEYPELANCALGCIHSHNNMNAFMSTTDLDTLVECGKKRNHFLSLVTNNKGEYCAFLAVKSSETIRTEKVITGLAISNKNTVKIDKKDSAILYNAQIITDNNNSNKYDNILKSINKLKNKVIDNISNSNNSNNNSAVIDTPFEFTSNTYTDYRNYSDYGIDELIDIAFYRLMSGNMDTSDYDMYDMFSTYNNTDSCDRFDNIFYSSNDSNTIYFYIKFAKLVIDMLIDGIAGGAKEVYDALITLKNKVENTNTNEYTEELLLLIDETIDEFK